MTPDASKCNELSNETKLVNYVDVFGKDKCVKCFIQTFLMVKGERRKNMQHDTVNVNNIKHNKGLKELFTLVGSILKNKCGKLLLS